MFFPVFLFAFFLKVAGRRSLQLRGLVDPYRYWPVFKRRLLVGLVRLALGPLQQGEVMGK